MESCVSGRSPPVASMVPLRNEPNKVIRPRLADFITTPQCVIAVTSLGGRRGSPDAADGMALNEPNKVITAERIFGSQTCASKADLKTESLAPLHAAGMSRPRQSERCGLPRRARAESRELAPGPLVDGASRGPPPSRASSKAGLSPQRRIVHIRNPRPSSRRALLPGSTRRESRPQQSCATIAGERHGAAREHRVQHRVTDMSSSSCSTCTMSVSM